MKKIDRKERARTLIDKQPVDTLFSVADLAELNYLTGWEMVAAKKVFNHQFPSNKRNVAVSADGVSFEPWSWVKAIEGYRFTKNVTQAMRRAIRQQVDNYAVLAPSECVSCGAISGLGVDHKTKAFTKIAANFRTDYPHLNYDLANSLNGSGWELQAEQTSLAWQQYHAEQADYQILCGPCNSRKGSR